ncbi:hypothetical protein VTP01DRAFT_8138 [Rhizomucor pusillus]|uniref:uncharacterized protein n=1 Tax=Rhizomucor pusillus TaxID=4840 RepID=UPI003742B962
MDQPDFETSELGTKAYWDAVYDRENTNFNEIGDIGEIWFGEESVQKMVQWVCDHVTDPQSSIVDLGCGNGHLLLELAAEGYKNLHGIDYSEAAITLAKSVAQQREYGFIKYDTVDLLAGTWDAQFDVILDKGTFDAISLNPELPDARQKYVSAVRKIIKPQGLVLITSCNWTQDELVKLFGSEFVYHSHVKYPTFSFGGHSGSKICTVAFSTK